MVKGVDPLDNEYIDLKIEEKFENIYPEWKKQIKAEVLKEVQKELDEVSLKIKSCHIFRQNVNYLMIIVSN